MLQKILNKLGSRRFHAWLCVLVLIIFGKIDNMTFTIITAVYIGFGAVEKIAYLLHGRK
jgi:hypothetical protein